MTEELENERVIAVFPDEDAATEAAQAARTAGAGDVHLGDSRDEVAALQSEMQAEAVEARPGFFTRDMAWSVPLWMTIGALAGAVLALPTGLSGAESVSLTTRLLVAVAFGAAIGGTIGFFFGTMVVGRLGRGAYSALDAESGVVVGATENTTEVTPALTNRDPSRVAKVAPTSGRRENTVTENS
ncbi:MAG: hypothetical protein ACRDZ3_04740 [Acidimicrobiia bacterium]